MRSKAAFCTTCWMRDFGLYVYVRFLLFFVCLTHKCESQRASRMSDHVSQINQLTRKNMCQVMSEYENACCTQTSALVRNICRMASHNMWKDATANCLYSLVHIISFNLCVDTTASQRTCLNDSERIAEFHRTYAVYDRLYVQVIPGISNQIRLRIYCNVCIYVYIIYIYNLYHLQHLAFA